MKRKLKPHRMFNFILGLLKPRIKLVYMNTNKKNIKHPVEHITFMACIYGK